MSGFRSSAAGFRVCGLLILLALAAVGCPGQGGGTGTVEGTVTIDGKPANAGFVVFTVKGQTVTGPIQPDGNYTAIGVPVGNAEVSLNPPANLPAVQVPGGTDMPQTAGPVAKPIPIPKKYLQAGSSGLSTTVKSGKNKYPIELSSR
jgi:hypothetical protein